MGHLKAFFTWELLPFIQIGNLRGHLSHYKPMGLYLSLLGTLAGEILLKWVNGFRFKPYVGPTPSNPFLEENRMEANNDDERVAGKRLAKINIGRRTPLTIKGKGQT